MQNALDEEEVTVDELIDDIIAAMRDGDVDTSHIDRLADAIAAWLSAQRRQEGTVARWRPSETFGFVEDGDGRTWFVSRRDAPLPPAGVREGATVLFTDAPSRRRGRGKYPCAKILRVMGRERNSYAGEEV